MLKQRIITASLLATVVIWGMLSQPVNVVFNALIIMSLISGWEWAQLSGIKHGLLRATYAAMIAALVYVAQKAINANPQWFNYVISASVFFWFAAIYYMFTKGPQQVSQSFSIVKILLGVIVLIPPVLALVYIKTEGSWWMFYCLGVVWIADIGAYFSGKRYGKTKLAPNISPGKTKEGLYGAVFATAAYSFIAGVLFELQVIQMMTLMIVTVLATFISAAGDLFVSLLKREKGLKDTGNILPGHGGLLDRIDSVLSSAPFLALLLGAVIFNV